MWPPVAVLVAAGATALAWVRTPRGDPLSAEQLLLALPSLFSREIGDRHPLTQLARERLAGVLEVRGSPREASAHRDDAQRAITELLGELGPPGESRTTPTPFAVVAHLAPNAPEREGFRRASDDSYIAPVTSKQRMFAGRAGWLLVVRAAGECTASIDVGRDVRRVGVQITGTPGDRFRVSIPGSTPALPLQVPPRSHASVVVEATGDGVLRVRTGDGQAAAGRLDTTAPGPDPPYALRFRGATPDACQLVWWESRDR